MVWVSLLGGCQRQCCDLIILAYSPLPGHQLGTCLYRHLVGGPVVYGTTDWNLTSLEAALDRNPPRTDRAIVFECYWMDWADREAGRELSWGIDRSAEAGGFDEWISEMARLTGADARP